MKTLKDLLNTLNNNYPVLKTHLFYQKIKPTLSASFVIPTYNSARTLEPCIKSIISQTAFRLINEIIIIEDCSSDKSFQIATKLAKKYYMQFKFIIKKNHERKYAAYCRNRGINLSTGNVICFIDSDIILPPNYLEEHLITHRLVNSCITFSLRSDIGLKDISNIQFPVKDYNNEFRLNLLKKYNNLRKTGFKINNNFSLAELCLTCAVTYKRKDLQTVKGCPENFRGWGFNDSAIAAKVITLGRYVIPLPETSVYHIKHSPRSGSPIRKKQEFLQNKVKYEQMMRLPYLKTFRYKIKELEI